MAIQTQEVVCNRVTVPEACQKDTLVTLLRNYGYWAKVKFECLAIEPYFDVEFEDDRGATNVALTSHDFHDWMIRYETISSDHVGVCTG